MREEIPAKGIFRNNGFKKFGSDEGICPTKQLEQVKIDLLYFDANVFETRQNFNDNLPQKPNIILYAAGFLVQNDEAFFNFDRTLQMMHTNYCGAVSILILIAFDKTNKNLERTIGAKSSFTAYWRDFGRNCEYLFKYILS